MAKKRRGNGGGTVYPRKNKDGKVIGYRGSYFTPDGKRRYVSGKTKTEAQRALRKATADRDVGMVFDAGSITLGEYLERWLSTSVRGTVRRSTYVRYEGLVRNHINPSIGRMKLKGLTPTHVRSLYRKKLDSGLAPRSVNYIHVTLHKALEQAVLDGLVPRNVSEGVKAPQVREEEIKPLSPTQVRALLAAAREDRLEGLYVLAIHTGLRAGRVVRLEVDRHRLQ
jgi:integrase